MKFINSELSEWRDIGFAFTCLDDYCQEEVDGLEEAIDKAGGFVLGNLDFALSMPLEELESVKPDDIFMGQPEIASIINYRKSIGK